MRNRSGFCSNPGIGYINKVFAVLVVITLLINTGCTGGIHQAAETGDMKKIKALLKENPSLVNEKDSYGMTALHWAVDKSHYGVAAMLIEEGANVNATDKNGETPLNYAITKEHRRMAAMLMLKGAKLSGSEDETREQLTRIAPLHQVAREDRLEDVETFLKRYPDQINARDQTGRTPLYWAARAGYIEVCEVLLANGANINATTSDGFTPLHGAVYYRKTETVELLLAKDADVNIQSNDGETAMHWAVRGGKKNLVEMLIAKGANLKVKDKDGRTPLDWADDDDIVELLRRHGGEKI